MRTARATCSMSRNVPAFGETENKVFPTDSNVSNDASKTQRSTLDRRSAAPPPPQLALRAHGAPGLDSPARFACARAASDMMLSKPPHPAPPPPPPPPSSPPPALPPMVARWIKPSRLLMAGGVRGRAVAGIASAKRTALQTRQPACRAQHEPAPTTSTTLYASGNGCAEQVRAQHTTCVSVNTRPLSTLEGEKAHS